MFQKKAFTLIELLLVIGIIAILAGIIILAINPSLQLQKAENSKRTAHVRSIKSAILQYQIDHGFLPAGIDSTVQDICAYGSTATGCINLDVLVNENYVITLDRDIFETNADHIGYTVSQGTGGFVEVVAQYIGNTGGSSVSSSSSSSSSSVAIAPPVWGSVSTQFNGGSTTFITVAKPSATSQDDLLLAIVMNGTAAATITAPSGWTSLQSVGGAPGKSEVFYKVATNSEPADYTFTASASNDMGVVILRYDDIDTASPIHISSGQAIPEWTNHRAPSVTTSINNTKIVYIYIGTILDSSGVYNVIPVGTTQRFYVEQPTDDFGLMVVDKNQLTAGATGYAQFDGYNRDSNVFTIAIKP